MKIGIIDSGVNASYGAVGLVAGGADFKRRDGTIEIGRDFADLLGHGTAVAATIRENALEAEIYALRIFRRRLTTHSDVLAAALDWAVRERLDVVNLSVSVPASLPVIDAARRAREERIVIVAPYGAGLPDAVEVVGDERLGDGEFAASRRDGRAILVASTWAREVPGLSRERGFRGVSFAVARATGLVSRALEERPELRRESALIDGLVKYFQVYSVSQMGD